MTTCEFLPMPHFSMRHGRLLNSEIMRYKLFGGVE